MGKSVPHGGTASICGFESLDSGLGPPENQGVNVMGTFIGIDHLQIYHVTGNGKRVGDSIAAEHVTSSARHIKGLPAGIPLHDGGSLDRGRSFVLHAP